MNSGEESPEEIDPAERAMREKEVAWLIRGGFDQVHAEALVERLGGLGDALLLGETVPPLPSKFHGLWENDPHEGRHITEEDRQAWTTEQSKWRQRKMARLQELGVPPEDVAPRSRGEYAEWLESHSRMDISQAPPTPIEIGTALFELTTIHNFNARGLRRCSVPGVAIHIGGRAATADFWTEQSGHLVIRFSTTHQRHSYRGRMKSGAKIPEASLKDFAEYVSALLVEWADDGLDEPPWVDG